MKRSTMLLGFLLLIAIDTCVQIGFKLAGNNTLPVTLDLPWLERVTREPWLIVVLIGYGAAFLVYIKLIKHAPIGPAFAASHLEIKGKLTLGDFTLTGVADRIDILKDGKCAILDYKTGALPSIKQVTQLLSPQLPLEAAMLAEGGFAGIGKRIAEDLIYLSLAGEKQARTRSVAGGRACSGVRHQRRIDSRVAHGHLRHGRAHPQVGRMVAEDHSRAHGDRP